MTSRKQNKIGIIGGGIGGLTMALTLKRNQLDFKIFEKSKEFTAVGAGIGIAANAMKIFDKLAVGDELRAKGHLIKKTILATDQLKTLKVIPFPDEVYCIHRASIIAVLSSQLNNDIFELNKELVSLENKDRVIVKFKDNTSAEFNTLIAADGINSAVRKSIFPETKIREANQIIWRGITDFNISSDLKHTYHELFSGTLRFLFLPISDTKIFWLAVEDKKNFNKDEGTSLKQYLLNKYHNFAPLVLAMLDKTKESDILENQLADLRPEYKKWYENNTVFIGDAIHAATPNLAQGACQAIEDAYTLGLCMKNNRSTSFAKYQKLRIQKVTYVVKESWMIGKMSLTNSTLKKQFLYVMLKFLPEKQYIKRFRRLIDIEYLNKIFS